jgi:lysophospholipase L1-like esterase
VQADVFTTLMKLSILTALSLALLSPLTHAQQPAEAKGRAKAAAPKPAAQGLGLKDGDRWVFIGDSITHQCGYTQFVENFYQTRHPEMSLTFRNAGISGDRAADVLDRWEDDVAAFQPTIATVLLGMNDGAYQDFNPELFAAYSKGMTEILNRLEAMKCKVIVMSPTMFDHQAWAKRIIEKPDYAKGRVPTHYNAVLAYYGKWLQEVARERGHRFVDLYGPLNTLTNQGRQKDKDFTLISDAIHPDNDGQFVMAWELLKQCGETGRILTAGAKISAGQWAPFSRNTSNVTGEPGKSLSYSVLPTALPWAEFQGAPLGTRLTNSGHIGGSESHVVVGLQPGRYDLLINGQLVHNYDERQLGVHAELQQDPDSPTAKQAFEVIAMNKKRTEELVKPMRGIYAQRKGQLRKSRESKDTAAFDAWWKENKARADELSAKADAAAAAIHQAAQPKELKVEIRPAQ